MNAKLKKQIDDDLIRAIKLGEALDRLFAPLPKITIPQEETRK